jgi:NAD(P)-dependent dehydrogenase (short-subunit alcohol dehydrogenase family)
MSGTTCLVTGATSGIGKETALRLAMLGATVVIVARDAARGAAARAEITGSVPLAQVEVMSADLSSLAQVRKLAADFLGEHGRLDVLVNNAGVKPSEPSALAKNAQAAARLWALSEDLTGPVAPVT